MPRLPRLVVPGYPHHITQRGVRSIDIFSNDDDRHAYLQFMLDEAKRFGVSFLGWCLMTNHIHLIAVPEHEDSLARAIGEAHRRYTRRKNFASGVRGYLFQGRFNSCVMDEEHLLVAGRYVERNPVVAKMAQTPQEHLWSSCRFHCGLSDRDPLVSDPVLPSLVDDWKKFLQSADDEREKSLKSKTRTGRPAGGGEFVTRLEVMTGRELRLKTPGRKRRKK